MDLLFVVGHPTKCATFEEIFFMLRFIYVPMSKCSNVTSNILIKTAFKNLNNSQNSFFVF